MNWDFPYSSQRMPLLARNIVATSQPLAAQAGVEMLKKGGNAVDAALATAIALTVVEPNMNGIGSDAFAIVWDGKTLHGLNGCGRAPKGWNLQRFTGRDVMPATGWDSVTVPGAVSAWVALSQRFGKLPFIELFVPAIMYAEKGYAVSPITARNWASQAEKYVESPDFAPAFLPNGRAPVAGELFHFPDQAFSLSMIAASKGEAFYRGELAQCMVAHSQAQGGVLALDDLAEHQVDWDAPIAQNYRGVTLHELPPNGQGIAALMMLGILQHINMSQVAVDSADFVHLQLEAMKLAFADLYHYVAEASAMPFSPETLLAPAYLAKRAKLIDPKRASFPNWGHPTDIPKGSETVYLSTADAGGMMVSYIQSNYMGFGSGVVVPGTGISLQNRGAGFSLNPDHPNCVAPRKRPFHTIIPGFVTQNGTPLMSFGVMGAAMQAQGHAQMVVRRVDYGQNPQAASDARRWFLGEDQLVYFEEGFDRRIIEQLVARGHRVADNAPAFGCGGAQLIYRQENGVYVAGSDHRKDGQAVGF
jgi:gamma-glutamyltranspeptidase / glutathione hydrolase